MLSPEQKAFAEANFGLVATYATREVPGWLFAFYGTYADVYQTCMLGMLKAVKGFNGGGQFSPYAYRCMRNALYDGARRQLISHPRKARIGFCTPVTSLPDEVTAPEADPQLQEAIDVLIKRKPKYADVLAGMLRGETVTETSMQIGMSRTSVQRRRAKIILYLRKIMGTKV